MDKRERLYQYSRNELSLRVFNDENLYNRRHTKTFMSYIESMFCFTDKQLEVLQNDLKADLKEIESDGCL